MTRFIIVAIIIGVVIFLSSWFFGQNRIEAPIEEQNQEQDITINQGDDIEDIEKDIIFLENDFNDIEAGADADIDELDSLIQVN